MPSSYTSSLRLTLPQTGELVGTWGSTVNNGVTNLVDQAVAGTANITMLDATFTLSSSNGASDQARCMFINAGGTLTANRDVICPSVSKMYVVTNNTSGGYSIVFKTLAGTGVTIPTTARATVYCDGTNVTAFGMYGTSDSTVSQFKGTLSLISENATVRTVASTTGLSGFSAGVTSSFQETFLGMYGNAATGTTAGINRASLGVLTFSLASAGLINTSFAGASLNFATSTGLKLKLEDSGTTTAYGTLAVSGLLSVFGTASGTGVYTLISNAASASASNATVLLWNDNGFSANYAMLSYWSSGSSNPNELRLFLGANAPLTFYTSGLERMRINGAGNVGIGVVPSSSWGASYASLEIGPNCIAWSNSGNCLLSSNVIQGSSGFIYRDSSSASYIRLGTSSAPDISWYGYGVAGASIPTSSPLGRLTVGNSLTFYSSTGSIGYAGGSGSSVTQLTSKSTAVTMNRPTGCIITAFSSLNGNTTVSFVLNNSIIHATDMVLVTLRSGATSSGEAYQIWVGEITTGTARICIRNITGGALSDQLFIQFAVFASDN